MTGVYPGVTIDRVRSRTGWDLAVSADLRALAAPTAAELAALHALQAMTPRS
jgi:glutaconate CoA-transferase subunit B